MAVQKNVYKEEVNKITLPSVAQREDRGLKLCNDPFLVLADTSDSTYWKNDRTGVAFKVDTLTVELEDENGNLEAAPGLAINFKHQADAKGFVIDWRQYVEVGVGLKTGCYKVKISYTKSGISDFFYHGSYRLLPYSTHTSEGQARLFVVLDDYVRTDGINYKDSGFATTVRFKGKFGYMQPNVEIENLTKVNRVREKIRNEALRTYELRTDYMLSCLSQKIDNDHLLAASLIYISDYNADNHVEYKDFPCILDESQSYEFQYSEGTPYASIRGYFLDKRAYYESKYDGNIPANENVILDLPQGQVSGACPNGTNNIYQSDGTTLLNSVLVPSGSTVSTNVADSVITVNTAPFADLPATDALDIPVHDSAGSDVGTVNAGVVDIADSIITLNTNEVTDNVLAEGSKNYNLLDLEANPLDVDSVAGDNVTLKAIKGSTAPLMATGQTTVYTTGDDASVGYGRDFFTLSKPIDKITLGVLSTGNWVGNTNRFTDTTGAQTYANDIVLDWSTFDVDTGQLLFYSREILAAKTRDSHCTDAMSYSLGGFATGWRLTNRREGENILDGENYADAMAYAPFGLPNYTKWLSTSLSATTGFIVDTVGRILSTAITGSNRAIYVRTGNISEL